MTRDELNAFVAAVKRLRESVTDEQALTAVGIYPRWREEKKYTVGVRVQYKDILYKCLQSHTSQNGWSPDIATSLWAIVLIPDPEVIPDWVQPDSTNAYMIGDKVRFEGHVYKSLIDNNIWSPTAYPSGWELVA